MKDHDVPPEIEGKDEVEGAQKLNLFMHSMLSILYKGYYMDATDYDMVKTVEEARDLIDTVCSGNTLSEIYAGLDQEKVRLFMIELTSTLVGITNKKLAIDTAMTKIIEALDPITEKLKAESFK